VADKRKGASMILIYYFSGTGNTKYIAEKIGLALQKRGADCQVRSIDEKSPVEASEEIKDCRAVLFGYPIYGSYTSELIVAFLKEVQVPAHVKVGFFCTQMLFSGDGARVGHELLSTKAETWWGMHFNMPNNLNCGRLSFLPVSNDPEKIRRKYLNKADAKTLKLARLVDEEQKHCTGFSFISRFLGLLQRPGYLHVYRNYWHAAMQIDQSRCTHCGLCYQQCPAANIKNEKNHFFIQDHCVLCMRCYNFCPEMAVLFLGQVHPRNKARYQGLVSDTKSDNKF
jgi:ferredoxin